MESWESNTSCIDYFMVLPKMVAEVANAVEFFLMFVPKVAGHRVAKLSKPLEDGLTGF